MILVIELTFSRFLPVSRTSLGASSSSSASSALVQQPKPSFPTPKPAVRHLRRLRSCSDLKVCTHGRRSREAVDWMRRWRRLGMTRSLVDTIPFQGPVILRSAVVRRLTSRRSSMSRHLSNLIRVSGYPCRNDIALLILISIPEARIPICYVRYPK